MNKVVSELSADLRGFIHLLETKPIRNHMRAKLFKNEVKDLMKHGIPQGLATKTNALLLDKLSIYADSANDKATYRIGAVSNYLAYGKELLDSLEANTTGKIDSAIIDDIYVIMMRTDFLIKQLGKTNGVLAFKEDWNNLMKRIEEWQLSEYNKHSEHFRLGLMDLLLLFSNSKTNLGKNSFARWIEYLLECDNYNFYHNNQDYLEFLFDNNRKLPWKPDIELFRASRNDKYDLLEQRIETHAKNNVKKWLSEDLKRQLVEKTIDSYIEFCKRFELPNDAPLPPEWLTKLDKGNRLHNLAYRRSEALKNIPVSYFNPGFSKLDPRIRSEFESLINKADCNFEDIVKYIITHLNNLKQEPGVLVTRGGAWAALAGTVITASNKTLSGEIYPATIQATYKILLNRDSCEFLEILLNTPQYHIKQKIIDFVQSCNFIPINVKQLTLECLKAIFSSLDQEKERKIYIAFIMLILLSCLQEIYKKEFHSNDYNDNIHKLVKKLTDKSSVADKTGFLVDYFIECRKSVTHNIIYNIFVFNPNNNCYIMLFGIMDILIQNKDVTVDTCLDLPLSKLKNLKVSHNQLSSFMSFIPKNFQSDIQDISVKISSPDTPQWQKYVYIHILILYFEPALASASDKKRLTSRKVQNPELEYLINNANAKNNHRNILEFLKDCRNKIAKGKLLSIEEAENIIALIAAD